MPARLLDRRPDVGCQRSPAAPRSLGVRGLRQLRDGLPSGSHLPPHEARRMSVNPDFVPEITAFSCSYCGYMAADTAGALRQEYPANVKLVRLPCTGKTDGQYLLGPFEDGADAVE